MKKFSLAIIIILISFINQFGQTEVIDKSKINNEKVYLILKESSGYFNQGLIYFRENRRTDARKEFDKSIEVFLVSGINIQETYKLQNCYKSLVETIYRIEFPLPEKTANIKGLSDVCGWNTKDELSNDIAKLVRVNPNKNSTSETTDSSLIASPANNGTQDEVDYVGFSEQKFEFVPLDELAQLELNETQTDLSYNRYVTKNSSYSIKIPSPAGTKPIFKNGKIKAVIDYIYNTFHNPYTVVYVAWSKVVLVEFENKLYWEVSVKLRAKNTFNAFVLQTRYFYIRNNETVFSSLEFLGEIYRKETESWENLPKKQEFQ